MPNSNYIPPFGEQDVFRTVSIAFQPYLPFTQAYAMQLKDTNASVAGASNTGYFDLHPEDNASLGDNERSGYPYSLRRQIYQGAGEGRTAIMSSMMNREDNVVNTAESLDKNSASDIMGSSLAQLLDTESAALTAPAVSGRYRDEIEIKMLDFINEFTDMDMANPRDLPSDALSRDTHNTGRSKDFDLYLENNDTFKQYVQSILPEKIHDIRSAEVSRENGVGASKKIIANVENLSTDTTRATDQWRTHIRTEVDRWNARIVTDWQANQYPEGTGDPSAAQYEVAKRMFDSDAAGSDNYDLRQFINRVGRSRGMAQSASYGMEPIRHVYQVTLSPNAIGFTTFYPTAVNGIPQIGFDDNNVQVVEAVDGNVISSLSSWMQSQAMSDSILMDHLGSLMHSEATSTAVSRLDRVERAGDYKAAQLALDFENKVQLTIKGTGGQMHLTITEIAANLRTQLDQFYNNAQTQANFAVWYEALMEKSNDLSKDWYNAVGNGPKNKTSLSEEWQFGDDKGNPRKHFLGVWNKESEDAWKGTGSGQVGYNFSISPLVTSRREGTASFR